MRENHLGILSEYLYLCFSNYGKKFNTRRFRILGDVKKNHMKCFCDTCGLKNLIKQHTCYKNSEKPTCIDLMLTNVPCSFYRTCMLDTGFSDFHLMTLAFLRKYYKKIQSRLLS